MWLSGVGSAPRRHALEHCARAGRAGLRAHFIEMLIDEIDGSNQPLKTFILPGGCELASRLHLARGIARRCEREVTALRENDTCGDSIIIWINRISDLLFAMARVANRVRGIEDRPWHPPTD